MRVTHRWMLQRAVMQGAEEFGDRRDRREFLGALPHLLNQSQVWAEVLVGYTGQHSAVRLNSVLAGDTRSGGQCHGTPGMGVWFMSLP